jgi:hypothetical protein
MFASNNGASAGVSRQTPLSVSISYWAGDKIRIFATFAELPDDGSTFCVAAAAVGRTSLQIPGERGRSDTSRILWCTRMSAVGGWLVD